MLCWKYAGIIPHLHMPYTVKLFGKIKIFYSRAKYWSCRFIVGFVTFRVSEITSH